MCKFSILSGGGQISDPTPALFKGQLYFFKFIYLFWDRERERERVNVCVRVCVRTHTHTHTYPWLGEGQRGRERVSQAWSALSAQSPMWSSNPQNMRSWPEPKSRVGHLNDWDTQTPPHTSFLNTVLKLPNFKFCHVGKSSDKVESSILRKTF